MSSETKGTFVLEGMIEMGRKRRPLLGGCEGSSVHNLNFRSLPMDAMLEPVVGCSHFA